MGAIKSDGAVMWNMGRTLITEGDYLVYGLGQVLKSLELWVTTMRDAEMHDELDAFEMACRALFYPDEVGQDGRNE